MALSKPKWLFDIDEFKDSVNRKVHVDTISISDVDDPEIYVSVPLYEWQQTEKGKWVIEHSAPAPSFHRYVDHLTYGYTYRICAYLNEKDYIFYRLKFE